MIASRAEEVGCTPCLVVAHGDPAYAALVHRSFRQLGWRVRLAESGPAARHLARTLSPAAVVLATDLDTESGWLTCAKLTAEQPRLRVFLVASNPTGKDRRFADFVGAAALLSKGQGAQPLVDELANVTLPAAG